MGACAVTGQVSDRAPEPTPIYDELHAQTTIDVPEFHIISIVAGSIDEHVWQTLKRKHDEHGSGSVLTPLLELQKADRRERAAQELSRRRQPIVHRVSDLG
jgi:hypothetical protein